MKKVQISLSTRYWLLTRRWLEGRNPVVEGAKVEAKVIKHGKAKVIVFKYA